MADDRNAADGRQPNVSRDTDGRGSANQADGTDAPRDADEQAVNEAFEGRGAREQDRGPDAIDLEDMSGARRREPGR